MKLPGTHIIIIIVLFAAEYSAASSAVAPKTAPAAPAPAKVTNIDEGRTVLEYRLEIFERASANRELAALTQMEQARELEKQALEIQEIALTESSEQRIETYQKAGKLETDAAKLCGLAAANFDQAAVNRKQVEVLSTSLKKVELQRSARAHGLNLKQQANNSMQMASLAYEKAAEAYDKAGDQVNLAAASQLAAVWLEKLAIR